MINVANVTTNTSRINRIRRTDTTMSSMNINKITSETNIHTKTNKIKNKVKLFFFLTLITKHTGTKSLSKGKSTITSNTFYDELN